MNIQALFMLELFSLIWLLDPIAISYPRFLQAIRKPKHRFERLTGGQQLYYLVDLQHAHVSKAPYVHAPLRKLCEANAHHAE